MIIPPTGMTPLPTNVSAVAVPPTVRSSAMFASSVDVSCSAVIVALAVTDPVTSTFPVTFCPPENVDRPATSRVSKAYAFTSPDFEIGPNRFQLLPVLTQPTYSPASGDVLIRTLSTLLVGAVLPACIPT